MRINPAVLDRLRYEAGWSQARLAREAGVDQATISRILSGASGGLPATIKALADALGVSVDVLCASEDEAA